MYYSKIREVKSPIRGTSTSAGIDFFVPKFTNKFIADLQEKNQNNKFDIIDNKIALHPHHKILIPAGIKVNLERTLKQYLPDWSGIYLNAHNKSGIASKKGLIRGAETIDEDYQGEIHINVINTSNEIQFIEEDAKLIQFILEETAYLLPQELDESELFDAVSERGDGGFGSTGK